MTGKELSQLEDAWLPLLEPFPWDEPQADGLALRGRILFGVGARMLAAESADAKAAGAFWSLTDGAAHCTDPVSRARLLGDAQAMLSGLGARLPRRLRPLTVLAALAAADLARESSGVKRLSAAVRHRLWGSFPR